MKEKNQLIAKSEIKPFAKFKSTIHAKFWIICIIIFGQILQSCNNQTAEAKKEAKPSYVTPKNEVRVQILQKTPFMIELLANGRLEARQKNILKFEVSGALQKLKVKNGDRVSKGDVLASVRAIKYQQSLAQAKTALQKTRLDFEDILVGRGYDLNQRDSIPDNIFDMADIRSGYQEARNQLKSAEFEVNSTSLRAPFKGKVADIQFKLYENITAGTKFMTLIDDRVFNVKFYLIESEIEKIKIGGIVSIEIFGTGKQYQGKITSINPLVEKNGSVLIEAKLNNKGVLLEGMNAKVRIQREVSNQFVVPKSALVLRQNQEVIFKYQNEKTYWTYVKIVHENSTHFSIIADPDRSSATLREGDTIIISNNLNLAHDVNVTIKN